MNIQEIVNALEHFAPLPLQESYDNAGLLVGFTEEQEATGALLCLDITPEVIDEAVEKGLNVVIAHHPIIFTGVKQLHADDFVSLCVMKAVKDGVALYAAHTNLDNAYEGVNFALGHQLGLQDMRPLIPHPNFEGHGGGLIGRLPEPMSSEAYLQKLMEVMDCPAIQHNPYAPIKDIEWVAMCTGSGSFMIDDAKQAGADTFLTGEVKYHEYFGYDNSLLITAAGHYETEQFAIGLMESILNKALPELPTAHTTVCTNAMCTTLRK